MKIDLKKKGKYKTHTGIEKKMKTAVPFYEKTWSGVIKLVGSVICES